MVELNPNQEPTDERRIVSASGIAIPRLLYGSAWKKERTAELVELALRSGFRGVDTACQPRHYHEPGVGEALSAIFSSGLAARSEIYVQTKFTPFAGQDPSKVPYDPRASLTQQVLQSFEASLRNLRVSQVDGLVLHSPYPDDKDTFEVWRAMEGLYDQGVVRQLGVSNCYELTRLDALCQKARIRPATIQNRFHAKSHYDREIRAFCDGCGIIYQSFWTLTANVEILKSSEMTDLAKEYGRSPAQIFFRYLTQRDIVCLTGTSSTTHMAQDLSIFEFRLSSAACETLDALLLRSAP
ncbi:MAG: aldo/keto reductase family protein [Methylocystis sp.]